MFKKKECVAMLLAGGQGSRLYALTEKTAKPAVTFGGKYRIIDFTLSNCVHSGLDTVGVLTQYQPLVLNEYIGTGLPWDLDRNYGGVKILPGQKRCGLVPRHRQRHLSESEFYRALRRRLRADPVWRPHLPHGLFQDAGAAQGNRCRLHHCRH